MALFVGVFQNSISFEEVRRRRDSHGFTVSTQALVPTNDGGLALGQVSVGARWLAGTASPATLSPTRSPGPATERPLTGT